MDKMQEYWEGRSTEDWGKFIAFVDDVNNAIGNSEVKILQGGEMITLIEGTKLTLYEITGQGIRRLKSRVRSILKAWRKENLKLFQETIRECHTADSWPGGWNYEYGDYYMILRCWKSGSWAGVQVGHSEERHYAYTTDGWQAMMAAMRAEMNSYYNRLLSRRRRKEAGRSY